MKHTGPPITLGNATAAPVRLIVWCLGCGQMPLKRLVSLANSGMPSGKNWDGLEERPVNPLSWNR
jgi:hypothetical protein